mmetsp:Transcript_9142/g.29010  ORF Transcript_9142/g.29010 Transcript_9142/m.29010 type:complete len:382 (-) Transcript_9142:396-1541(-)
MDWLNLFGNPTHSRVVVHNGHHNVDDPQEHEEGRCCPTPLLVAAKLSTQELPPGSQGQEAEDAAGAEDSDAEAEAVGLDYEAAPRVSLGLLGVPPVPFAARLDVRDAPVDGGDHPGQPQAQEDVHGVAAGDVPDGVVRRGVLPRGEPRRECVREAGAQRDERDGGDVVPDAQAASQERRELADEGRDGADHEQGAREAGPAAADARGRDEGEEHLPGQGDGMEEPLERARARLLPGAAVAVEGGRELARPLREVEGEAASARAGPLGETARPAGRGGTPRSDHDDVAECEGAALVGGPAKLHARAGVAEDHPEAVAVFRPEARALQDGYLHGPQRLAVPEDDPAVAVLEVPPRQSRPLDGPVRAADLAAGAMRADDAQGHG